jgi:hypothetical protein
MADEMVMKRFLKLSRKNPELNCSLRQQRCALNQPDVIGWAHGLAGDFSLLSGILMPRYRQKFVTPVLLPSSIMAIKYQSPGTFEANILHPSKQVNLNYDQKMAPKNVSKAQRSKQNNKARMPLAAPRGNRNDKDTIAPKPPPTADRGFNIKETEGIGG